jgi:hypothetical protein
MGLDNTWFVTSEVTQQGGNEMQSARLRLATVFAILLLVAELVGFGGYFYASWWGEPDIGTVTDSGWTAVRTGGGGRFGSALGRATVHLIEVAVRGRAERFSAPYRIDAGTRVRLLVAPSSVTLGSAPSANFTLSMLSIVFTGIAVTILLSFKPAILDRMASRGSPD